MLGKLTMTSSRWARRTRPPASVRWSIRGGATAPTPRWCRAARPAARRRRGGTVVHGRDRNRHRRLDPPASGIYRDRRHEPTYGRCSRWGIVAFASSLDQAGPIARTVRDAAILMRSMAGHDPKDTTSVDRAVPDYEAAIGKSVNGMKIGIPREYRLDGMPAEIEKLWSEGAAWLRSAGRRNWSTFRCLTPNTRFRLIILSRRLRPRRISRAMTACATACGHPGAASARCMKHPRRRLWRRSPPPRHDRHLRALGRLLRRLLSARPESPHPDQEGF